VKNILIVYFNYADKHVLKKNHGLVIIMCLSVYLCLLNIDASKVIKS